MRSDHIVSVVIPAYRTLDDIARVVRSVLAQTCQDFEIVIIADDGQDYLARLHEEGIRDARIAQYVTPRPQCGPAIARNIGLMQAQGRFIAMLDSDDEFKPEKLALCVPMAREFGMVTGAVEYGTYQPDGSFLTYSLWKMDHAQGPIYPREYLMTSHGMQSMLVFDRDQIPHRWPEEYAVMEDLIFVIQAFNYVPCFYYFPQLLHRYVKRPDSLSHSNDAPVKFMAAKLALEKALLEGSVSLENPEAMAVMQDYLRISMATEIEHEALCRQGADSSFAHLLVKYLKVYAIEQGIC